MIVVFNAFLLGLVTVTVMASVKLVHARTHSLTHSLTHTVWHGQPAGQSRAYISYSRPDGLLPRKGAEALVCIVSYTVQLNRQTWIYSGALGMCFAPLGSECCAAAALPGAAFASKVVLLPPCTPRAARQLNSRACFSLHWNTPEAGSRVCLFCPHFRGCHRHQSM